MVAILLLSLIPIAGVATPVIALLVECYYYGFSMLDYSCERRNMNAQESIYYIGNHRGWQSATG